MLFLKIMTVLQFCHLTWVFQGLWLKLVVVVEQPGVDAGPVVKRHGTPPSVFYSAARRKFDPESRRFTAAL